MPHARTRIVCTVGPASQDHDTLVGMLKAGADVFRVNGAHAAPDSIGPWVRRIRRAAREAACIPAVFVDLPGIKMRTGRFEEPVELERGRRVALFPGKTGGSTTRIPVHPLPELASVKPGREVLLDDGRIRLRALRRKKGELVAVVEDGGLLDTGRGVAFPGSHLPTEVPTRRDRQIARAAIQAGADWLGLSFVRHPLDVGRLRALTEREGARRMPIAAKIERGDALASLDQILHRADAVMVARGDLGVDIGAERVPLVQKQIIEEALRVGRPVVVATEMLDSMQHRTRPTRAEASDVAGAVFEGADAVMLSAETAVGEHPVLAVETMERILRAAESDDHALHAVVPTSLPGRPDQHVVHAAVTLAEETQADAIVVFSRSGASAVRLSKERPRAPIYAFAPKDDVCRRLSLAWGVHPRRLPAGRSTDAVVEKVLERLRTDGGLAPGARAVLVMGGAKDPAGATSLIKLLSV